MIRERKGEEKRESETERDMATHYQVISKIFTPNSTEHHHEEKSGKEIIF